MVIQRIQTLYLIIAIGLMIAFFFVPFGYTSFTDAATAQSVTESLKGIGFLGLIIPVSLSLLSMAIAIFSFKNPGAQKVLIVFALLLIGACVGVVIYILAGGMIDTDPEIATRTVWGGGGLLLIASLLALLGAYRGVAADQKLLRDYDRLR